MFVCCGRRCRSAVFNENACNRSTNSTNNNNRNMQQNPALTTRTHEAAALSSHSAASSSTLRSIFQRTTSRVQDEQIAALEQQQQEHHETQQPHSSSTTVAQNTPILFATNRGLHLRLAQMSRPMSVRSGPTYDINFCDLERWSTNRANTVSLEDTFTVVKHHPPTMTSSTSYQSGFSGHGSKTTGSHSREGKR